MRLLEICLSFDGRINRSTYWKGYLVLIVAGVVLALIARWLDTMIGLQGSSITDLFSMLALWPWTALNVKRWHDLNKSGWWILIVLIPVIGIIWAFIEIGFLAGTKGHNRFGREPK